MSKKAGYGFDICPIIQNVHGKRMSGTMFVHISSELVEISSEPVQISSELVEISSELVSSKKPLTHRGAESRMGDGENGERSVLQKTPKP